MSIKTSLKTTYQSDQIEVAIDVAVRMGLSTLARTSLLTHGLGALHEPFSKKPATLYEYEEFGEITLRLMVEGTSTQFTYRPDYSKFYTANQISTLLERNDLDLTRLTVMTTLKPLHAMPQFTYRGEQYWNRAEIDEWVEFFSKPLSPQEAALSIQGLIAGQIEELAKVVWESHGVTLTEQDLKTLQKKFEDLRSPPCRF